MTSRILALTATLVASLSACATDGSTSAPTGPATTGPATAPLEVAGGRVTNTTAPGESDDLKQFIDGLVLDPGATYRLGGSFGSDDITFTFLAPDAEVHSYVVPGLVFMSADELGAVSLLSVLNLAGARTYTVPSPDASQIVTPDDLLALSAPLPGDPFEWLASQGFVTLTPVEETTFAGYPARVADYEFLEIGDGFPCSPVDPRPCIWTFGSFDTAITHYPGERGRFIEVDVDGDRYLIDVREQPGASEIASSLVISRRPPRRRMSFPKSWRTHRTSRSTGLPIRQYP